ncbi:hypothetical protein DICPUDRAFT_157908 [Dictyostelium purpureum]|uniref:Uncharacterized protein n=1 Tax=Dictyostelium purpureum TaxID=5786 RepID=F1A0B6_DICPU|nr:uncharacterized protein DICPUDRAFT_157908 [Dictyostelium purpureum]EGC30369.1 hypothetical protein DICPUDRAFT_157908 [Dictyostelium purpureum]|eukprot:XP_003293111.1 hypothetical protein DICPUDRAFT_157908 [Dictyostelium purpureum]
MNDYLVLFCQTIITLVISFLFGLGLIKYYFNNKGNYYGNYNNNCNGNNNDNHSYNYNIRGPSNYPAFNQCESRHSVSGAPQSSSNPESGHINKREPSDYPAFNQSESRHSVSCATQSNDNQESGHLHKRASSSYPTFNQDEARHSVSGSPQSYQNPESPYQCNGENFNGEPPCVEEVNLFYCIINYTQCHCRITKSFNIYTIASPIDNANFEISEYLFNNLQAQAECKNK